jgi:hypothetical protein
VVSSRGVALVFIRSYVFTSAGEAPIAIPETCQKEKLERQLYGPTFPDGKRYFGYLKENFLLLACLFYI